MNEDQLKRAARILCSRASKGRPKTLTDADRQRRRDWARGLAKIREQKRNPKTPQTRFVVIARDGSKSIHSAATGGMAMELARSQGIDAVGVRQEQKGKEQ